jgi:16S rRNA processing protein RimM
MEEFILVAKIGRVVGLNGELKLNLFTDFPEQFKKGVSFKTEMGTLEVERFNSKKVTVKFKGFEDRESARRLTGVKIYTSQTATRENCYIESGEYFWFDIIGCQIVEGSKKLGVVEDIQRLESVDYLLVSTSNELMRSQNLSKNFLIPYIDRYIDSVKIEKRKIFTKDAFLLLEAS